MLEWEHDTDKQDKSDNIHCNQCTRYNASNLRCDRQIWCSFATQGTGRGKKRFCVICAHEKIPKKLIWFNKGNTTALQLTEEAKRWKEDLLQQ